jgi:hypothetical protein
MQNNATSDIIDATLGWTDLAAKTRLTLRARSTYPIDHTGVVARATHVLLVDRCRRCRTRNAGPSGLWSTARSSAKGQSLRAGQPSLYLVRLGSVHWRCPQPLAQEVRDWHPLAREVRHWEPLAREVRYWEWQHSPRKRWSPTG